MYLAECQAYSRCSVNARAFSLSLTERTARYKDLQSNIYPDYSYTSESTGGTEVIHSSQGSQEVLDLSHQK